MYVSSWATTITPWLQVLALLASIAASAIAVYSHFKHIRQNSELPPGE